MAIPSSSSSKQEFPTREVIILALCVTVNSYTLVNLFPYVGIMVKELMGLESTNEAGKVKHFGCRVLLGGER